jgi:transposase
MSPCRVTRENVTLSQKNANPNKMKQDVIKLSNQQLKRYEVIIKAIDQTITVNEAAKTLGLSTRQIKRLKQKVKEHGAAALIHQNSLKRPAHALSEQTKEQIIKIRKQPEYDRCNIRHFRELLAEHHDIELSYTTLRNLLLAQGLPSPKTKRRFKPHRRRKRKSQAGLLLQVDATPYAWFKADRKTYALHGAIDDATGQITALFLTKNECLHGYFEMMRRTIQNYGVPVSLYADRHTIFQSPNKDKAILDPKLKVNDTQFGRCLKELDVNLIPARSPQAKGRIERLWGTLQSRLPVEFSLRDIRTIDEANTFLRQYIYAFNSEFAVEPQQTDSLFSPLREGLNLDYILCVKETRIIDSGGVFSFGGRAFKVTETMASGILPKGAKISVLADPAFGIKAQRNNVVFDVLPFIVPKKVQPTKSKKTRVPKPVPDNHYYKYGQVFAPKLSYTESDAQIIAMLEKLFLTKHA